MLPDVLENCLSQLEIGVPLDDVLAQYPDLATELRPLLETADHLHLLTIPPISPAQIGALESRIFQQIRPPVVARPPLWQTWLPAAAAVVVIAAVLLFLWSAQREDTPVATEVMLTVTAASTATLPPTATVALTETPTSQPTVTSTPTALPSATPVISEDAADFPLPITVTGVLAQAADGTLTVNDVPLSDLPVTTAVTIGETISITGTLSDAGMLLPDTATPAEATPATTACPVERCHPVLLIYAQSFNVPYTDLEALHRLGYGIGEIGRIYLLAQTTSTPPVEILAQREAGQSWGALLQTYPDVNPSELAPGSVISNQPDNNPSSNTNPGNSNAGGNGQGNANGNSNGNANGNSNGNANGQGTGGGQGQGNGNGNGGGTGRGNG